MPSLSDKTVLVAPLNWGLGHATRCIPIIRELSQAGIKVHLGSDGDSLALLREEFPGLPSHALASLNITYGKNFFWHLLRQSFHFFQTIKQDQQRINALNEKINFDYIVSDNRYGICHPKSYNILMTHQLQTLKPIWLRPLSRLMIKHLTTPFQACWIPDHEGESNLTGLMSKPNLSIPKVYIGIRSRLVAEVVKEDYELAVILSGPEPNRTNLEKKILKQFSHIHTPPKTILVRGLPSTNDVPLSPHPQLTILNFADSPLLNRIINSAGYVICRSGYTSIMDLLVMGKSALLIPTPGQTEQEYLAQRLKNHVAFRCCDEQDFELEKVLASKTDDPFSDNLHFSSGSITEHLP